MTKFLKRLLLIVVSLVVICAAAILSACGESDHPRAEITFSFNNKTYTVEYTLYRNMYPQTVRHFIELADAGFYNDTLIHDYTGTDWYGGGYSYDKAEATDYTSAFTGNSLADYLGLNSKEQAYYDLFANGKLSPSVYKTTRMDGKREYVDREDALPTLIGEFSENGHEIKQGALSASFGTLKMFYYSKDKKICTMVAHDGNFYTSDYKYNAATSIFAIQVSSTSSLSVTGYATFAELRNDNAADTLRALQDDISDYITDNLNNSTSDFTKSAKVNVDNLDTFAPEGSSGIERSFTLPRVPLIIKSVKITKY